MIKPEALTRWTADNAAELFGIRNWGAGYFDVSEKGEVVVRPAGAGGGGVSLMDIVAGLSDRGINMPVLVRFEDILESRLNALHEAFARAIRDAGYRGAYRGVYPIKVNQQSQVVDRIVTHGRRYNFGLEAGSKAELVAVLAHVDDPDALVVCNGYKDEEFADLALQGLKMGTQAVLVIETPSELPMVLDRARRMKIRPLLGIRAKLSARAGGHWNESAGDRSAFGLTPTQIMDIVDALRAEDMLDCLRMLHFHLGSQIPNIRSIQGGCREAARIYASLAAEGAPMGFLNAGGGLAVDYDGSHTNFASSSNYTLEEYAADLVEAFMRVCDESGVAHPTIVTESGRALVAHHSALLFNVLGVSRFLAGAPPEGLPPNACEELRNLMDVAANLKVRNLQESYHDAVYYRDELRSRFDHGMISLRERALADRIFGNIIAQIIREAENRKYVPDELQGLGAAIADVYFGNLSVFQSLPDVWAIDQIFPVMPIHRLAECPTRPATIADITCDSDGRICRFADLRDVSPTLRLHEFNGSPYYLGVFLVGAYQETLGDLHNLFGDTNVVSVRIGSDGAIAYDHECEGDTVADVLSYVEYEPAQLIERMRAKAERAVREGRITAQERREIMDAYEAGLRGYTYFET